MAVGVNSDAVKLAEFLAGERVELVNRFDLVAEHRKAPGPVFIMGGEKFHHIAPYPEITAGESNVIALELQLDKAAQQFLPVNPVAHRNVKGHARIGFRRADAINAADRGHDNHIAPLE